MLLCYLMYCQVLNQVHIISPGLSFSIARRPLKAVILRGETECSYKKASYRAERPCVPTVT